MLRVFNIQQIDISVSLTNLTNAFLHYNRAEDIGEVVVVIVARPICAVQAFLYRHNHGII